MKKLHKISLCFAAVAACILGGNLRPASAQTTPSKKLEYQLVKVKNVRPDMMAYWIDPAHQPVPQEYQNYLIYPKLSQEQINQYLPQIKVFEDSFKGKLIAAINSKNALMIYANQDDFDHDKALIESMDKPIEQVNVNIVMASADPQVLKTIPTQPLELQNAKPQDASYHIALMTKDADSLVKQLISSGKLKQLYSPRTTMFAHFPWPMGGSSATSATSLEMKRELGYLFPSEAVAAIEQKKIGLQFRSNIVVISTINADDTVTMSITISEDEYLVGFQEFESYEKQPSSRGKTVPDSIFIKSLYGGPATLNYTVKDNQSVLVTGLDRILSNGHKTGHNLIVIVTPRVLHRN